MKRWFRILLVATAATVFTLANHFDFPLCPVASTFGIPCPGCGLTRATLALLHGDVHTALHLHPLVWLLAPLFVAFTGGAVLELVRDPARPRRPSAPFWTSRALSFVALCVLVLTLGVWIARFAGFLGGPVPVTSLRQWLSTS